MNANNTKRTVKIAEVTDATRADEAEVVDMGEIDTMLSRYRKFTFRDPKPEEDPTVDQLSVLKDLLKPPCPIAYVDFCLWGPHGTRTQRAMKFDGLQLAMDGTLVRKQTLHLQKWLRGACNGHDHVEPMHPTGARRLCRDGGEVCGQVWSSVLGPNLSG